MPANDASAAGRHTSPRPPALHRASRYAAVLVAAVILTAVALLVWTTYSRIADLRSQDQRLVTLAVDDVARDIEFQLEALTRSLRLFAQNRRDLLTALADRPGDPARFEQILHDVRELFPEAFAVTLADARGIPYIEDFDGLVEEVCQRSITAFAGVYRITPTIHPNPAGYHFDLMTRVDLGHHGEGVFFVSFRPGVLTPLLGAHHLPRYQLVLLHRDIAGLIEVAETGSRDALGREFFLSETEVAGIAARSPVAGTGWELIALPRPGEAAHDPARLWTETGLKVALLLLVGVIAVWHLRRATRREVEHHRLLQAVSSAESQFIAEGDPRKVFDEVLRDLLELSASEYGFIGEILQTADGAPYLKTYAITNIAWNEETRRFYAAHAPKGMEFYNLDTLFGTVIKSGELLIANAPAKDPRAGGIPHGHPPLTAFLGVPLHHGHDFVGMIGLANRAGGYDAHLVEFLGPMLRSCANLFGAMRTAQRRAQAEAALRDSEIRQRAVFNTVVDAIITIDEQGTIETFNAAAEHMFGYAATEVIGRNVSLLMPEPHRSAHDGYLRQHLHTGGQSIIGQRRELHAQRKDWSVFPVELVVSEMRLERERKFVGVVRDITAQKQAERRLHETLSMQRAILDSTVYSVIATDQQGTILVFNPGAEHMLGYGSEAMIGQQTPAIIHDIDEVRERALELSEELGRPIEPGFEVFVAKARLGVPEEREWTYVRKDGSRLPVLLSVTALRDEEGEITGFLGIASDITERKKVDTMKNEFVSTVSHELRTPLTSIRGSLGLVIGGTCGEIPGKARTLLEIAANNSERLVRLINDILDIEKIESGRMKFDFCQQPIGPIVAQSLEAAAGYAQQYGVRFELTAPCPEVEVTVDTDRIVQVMLNLLSNAAKFSPPGGTVSVDVGIEAESLRIGVTDRGEGIPDEFRDRIFQKFAQADGSDSRRKGGTGLGLSICKAIVEKHHGHIGFESRRGAGTRFFFDLPVHAARRMEAAAEREARILICEDDQDVANLLQLMLRGWGFGTELARDAASLRRRLLEARFDAVVLDLGLPDQEGTALIRELRREPATAEIPIVVVSAKADEGRQQLREVAGVVDWLSKPIDPERLNLAVRVAARAPGRQRLRILHVEDDADVVKVVGSILGEGMEIIHAPSLAAARSRLDRERFNLVVLDIGLRDGSGLSLLPVLQRLQPPTPVVIFSGQEVETRLLESVNAALVKSRTTNSKLLDTIHRVIATSQPGLAASAHPAAER